MSQDQRYERGLAKVEAVLGKAAAEQLVESHKHSAPVLSRHVIEYMWGDLCYRNALDLKTRELVTVAALTAIGDCAPQLKNHIHGALTVGASPEELSEVITHVSAIAGIPRGLNASMVLKAVFDERGIKSDTTSEK